MKLVREKTGGSGVCGAVSAAVRRSVSLSEAWPRESIVLGRGRKGTVLVRGCVSCEEGWRSRRCRAGPRCLCSPEGWAGPGHPPAGGEGSSGGSVRWWGLLGCRLAWCTPTCTHTHRATALTGTSAAGCWFGSKRTHWVTANGPGWEQREKQGHLLGRWR